MSGLIGAYCAAPADLAARPEQERAWYRSLAAEPSITGLELPFADALHPSGTAHLAGLLSPRWRNVVSDIPGTDRKSRADSRYGLASDDPEGRDAALADARRLNRAVVALGPTVVAVELHAAPTGGSAASLARSLDELSRWDWGPATLCLEHVDAAVPGHRAEKGYLRVEEETRAVLAAFQSTGVRVGQSVNWGRSAIEGRDAATPLRHLEAMDQAGTLVGVVLSGAAASGPDAWNDVHLGMRAHDPDSLLDAAHAHLIREAVAQRPLAFLGVKMRAPVGLPVDAPFRQRLAPSLAALAHLADDPA